jgi:hypothetical protein
MLPAGIGSTAERDVSRLPAFLPPTPRAQVPAPSDADPPNTSSIASAAGPTHALLDVRVEVQRDPDARMPERLANDLRVDVPLQQPGRVRLPQIMEPDPLEPDRRDERPNRRDTLSTLIGTPPPRSKT